ncbi:MAG: ABC transporter permease [Deltaproteobacteria bacterium]|nr:ABC transporter permease [Deltaproteobacteria bacterium]
MPALRLAYRNVVGKGLRTWLNVAVLSLAYVLIIWHQGIFIGMLRHGSQAMIDYEVGGGQYWHRNYDPLDILSYDDAHGRIPAELSELISKGKATPILIRQAAIYPEARLHSVLLKGIDLSQTVLKIPSHHLKNDKEALPVLIGKRMAKRIAMKIDDYITIRWRDAKGTFDALEGKIVAIMDTPATAVDKGQLWVPLEALQKMVQLENEATLIVVGRDVVSIQDLPEWKFKEPDFLMRDIIEMVRGKRVGAAILYAVLLFLAMLAIFDTQVLAIFNRRKEIGTLMALGMSRGSVILLFTLEGAMNGILAMAVGAIYGIPLLVFTAQRGITLPEVTEEFGFAIPPKLFPFYSVGLIVGTVFIVSLTVTIVSFLPTRRILKMKPTDALRGKMS